MALTDFDKELLASNLLEAKTLEQLYEKEKTLTNARMIALQNEPVVGCLDYVHLKNIHAYLFSDVYEWAGKDRYEAGISAEFGKGTTRFTNYDKLPEVSNLLFDALKEEQYFQGQNIKTFAKSAAVFMNGLNILHPFREGNGRVQRIFMEYVAKEAGYVLSFKNITAQEMIQASIEGVKGKTMRMEKIFRHSLTPN